MPTLLGTHIFLFGRFTIYLPPDDGYNDADNGRQDIEETIWQIGECRHAKHGALRKSAGVPWY